MRDLPQPSAQALVPFISVADMMAIIHRVGLEAALRDLTDRIEADFRRWATFDKTARVASHSDIGVIELMPTSDGERYAFKYVNGHPANTRAGLQTVTAFGVLSQVATGYPLMFAEMTVLTALRTAATSALAARHLAPKGARVMALIGNGAQAEFQALALKAVCGIDTVRLYDVDPAATEKCERNLKGSGLTVIGCTSAEAAIEGAQIITTCTADKRNATVLHDNMIGAGVHINAIGGDCPGKTELAPAILERAQTFVEFEPQTRVEGEIQQMPADYPVAALWQVITGAVEGRRDTGQITLFDGVGFAIEDFTALNWLYDQVHAGSQMLDVIADPDDPRDLYGMLMRAQRPKA
ncbi:ornithine cyclodeaminase [Pararhodobacter zhoushanensis]|uniref:ornithine cyclodeaminase n=1 Tax=Pararhodobacter zhoushanensis TaxID=2479545 RepID=UPI000F8E25EA|nr:ornithine cyclodeaminase [Pararhodobacter zhoushanensis]